MALLAMLTLLPCHARAATDEAAQSFQRARAAFEQQDYDTALKSFEAAVNGGMAGPAVHFNIGVAAYRLGRYPRAAAAFLEAAQTPAMASLSYYNLGLVALAAGDRAAAKRWFKRSQDSSTDERLRELAATQLGSLAAPDTPRNWLGYGAFGIGYDDNVALVADSNVLGVSDASDSFAELQLAFSAPLDRAWRLDAGLVMLDYMDLDAFDQLSLNGGARYRLPVGDWSNEVGVQLAYTTLDGDGLEYQRMLMLQTRTRLPDDWHLRARYRHSDLDGLDTFDGLSGRRHELDARVSRTRGAWDVAFGYQFEANDYDDESLSAKRHELAMDVQRALDPQWTAAFELSWRHSNYDARDNGTENRAEVALAAIRALTTRWRLVFRYAYADNDSTRAEFDYHRSRISAGVEAVM